MTGRHRFGEYEAWFCPTCDNAHPSDEPCPAEPVESEPAYLRAWWAVYAWAGRTAGDIVQGIRGVRF